MDTKVTNVLFILTGAVLLAVHAGLFFYSKNVFNAIMALYIISYIIITLVFAYKKKECSTSTERDAIFYISMFIIGMELMVFVVSLTKSLKPATPSGYGF